MSNTEMPYRVLGSTGERVSAIGLGGRGVPQSSEQKRTLSGADSQVIAVTGMM